MIHSAIPITVGMTADSSVHLMLPVSCFIVSRVVEHGQCISENSIVQAAVSHVQPFATKSSRMASRFPISERLPLAVYAIIMIGRTISFAGNPRINAISITPSSPISRPSGSRNPAQ